MKSEPEKLNVNGMSNMPDAESDLFDLFEDSADIVNDDTETEKDLIVDESEECETGMTKLVPINETGIMKPTPVKAEVVEDASPVAIKATGYYPPQFWRPWLPYPVTAQGIFDLALTVVSFDPARLQLGFFYEPQLKRECEMLVPHPIPSFYPWGIMNALMLRRSNPGVFVCYAIDIVLTHYLKELNEEDYNEFI